MLTKLDRFLVLLERWDHPDGRALAARLRRAGGKSAQARVLESALHLRHPWVRANAATILGLIGERNSVDALIAALGDIDAEIRIAAAKSLAMIGDRRATPALVHALRDDEWDVRQEAVNALGALRDPEAAPALCAAATDLSWPVRLAVARALVHFDPGDTFQALYRLAQDEQANVRLAVIEPGHCLPAAQALEIIAVAVAGADQRVRHRAIFAVGRLKFGGVPQILVELLDDPDPSIQLLAANEFARRADASHLSWVLVLMTRRDPDLRPALCPALGRIGGREAILSLVDVLRSYQEEVRVPAAEALLTCAMGSNDPALRQALPLLKRLERQARGLLGDRRTRASIAYREALNMIEYVTRGKGSLPVAAVGTEADLESLPLPASPTPAASASPPWKKSL
jgi:HEAT repeat protein